MRGRVAAVVEIQVAFVGQVEVPTLIDVIGIEAAPERNFDFEVQIGARVEEGAGRELGSCETAQHQRGVLDGKTSGASQRRLRGWAAGYTIGKTVLLKDMTGINLFHTRFKPSIGVVKTKAQATVEGIALGN